jgi:hypothetical protein
MFWDNIIKFVVIVLVVILFSAIFIPLYKNIERFAAETPPPPPPEPDPYPLMAQYDAELKPIINRLCPIVIGIKTVIAKNANTPANTNPSMSDAKKAAQDAKNGNIKPPPQPPPSAQDMERSFQRMLLEAQYLLISCPMPTDISMLPPTTADDLGNTLKYIYGKTSALNKQIQGSLNGNLETGSSSNDDDPLANMLPLQRQAAMSNYYKIDTQYNTNNIPRKVALTKRELFNLFIQRITTLSQLKARMDINGYLTAIEKEYAELQKAESGELKPGPELMKSP